MPVEIPTVSLSADEQAYWLAVRAGEKPNAEIITGRCELWRSFNDEVHPKLGVATKSIKRWYNDLPSSGTIVLAGRNGCGKTHLAQAIKELYGYGCLYWSEIEFFRDIQDSYSGNGNKCGLIKAIERAKLFIYDDLGAYQTGNLQWRQSLYLDVFNQRCEAGLPNLITTNCNDELGDLENLTGSRIYSRLCGQIRQRESYVDMFGVPDYRLRNFR